MSMEVRRSWHRTIAFRLQCTAGLALVAALALAAVSVHFADRTKAAAVALTGDGIRGSAIAARLELLLQEHRALVESAPAQLDRARLTEVRRRLDAIGTRLSAEIGASAALPDTGDTSIKTLADQLGRELPDLLGSAKRVVDLAFNFVQDQALDVSQGPYATAADRLQHRIHGWRGNRTEILTGQATLLAESATELTSRVLGFAAAVVVLGALAALIARQVLRRLARIKLAILRLAARDTGVELPGLALPDEIGEVARAVQTLKVNAIRVGAQDAELHQAARRLEAALGNMSQGLCLFGPDHRLQLVNRRFCDIYGLDPSLVTPGLTFRDIVGLSIAAGNYPGRMVDEVIAVRLQAPAVGKRGAFMQELGDGRVVAVSECLMADGGWVTTYEDVTARRAAEERVAFLALHDALTSLPNRVALNDRLGHAVAAARRGVASAVLCLDLDRFKAVNDRLGHPVGDRLLVLVGKRLRALVRKGDMVARLGGDEFAVIQGGITRPEDVKLLAEQIIETIAAPFQVDGHHIVVGTTIGIAMAPGDGNDPDRLMRNADMALYRAKAEGRGTFCFFEAGMDARLQVRRQLESDLRSALVRSEYELFYQPLVELGSGEVSGFEALLRWHHPARGLVSPAEFIPVIEDIGLIIPVGEWVIRTACAQAAQWPGSMKVAVNLSPAQFGSPNLLRTVQQALATSGLQPKRLELEITESVLLRNTEATMTTLHELRGLGVRIAMDDFGTGYSSLSYLRSFPFDKIKIDQSFVRDLSTREDSIHVIRAVTGLCVGLGMSTTAEGVESPEQLAMLQGEGCTEVQGFLFSKPRPAGEVPEIIESIRAAAEGRGWPATAQMPIAAE